jgi:putative sterol carrier protein
MDPVAPDPVEWLVSRQEALTALLPAAVRVHLEIGEVGRYALISDDNRQVTIEAPGEARPDCRLRLSHEDFGRMARGEIDPDDVFYAGRIRAEGDLGLAIRVGRALTGRRVGRPRDRFMV